MSLERLGVVTSAVLGNLGAGIAVVVLGVGLGRQPSVLLGYALGVAVVAFVVSAGMTAWLYRNDIERHSLYAYPGFVATASLLALVAAGDGTNGGVSKPTSLLLVVAGLFVVAGLSLVFFDRVRASGV